MSNDQSQIVTVSDDTISVLKKLYQINQSLKIVKGQKRLRCINTSKTLAAFSTIDTEFPRDFCVYDLNELISILGIISEPQIDLSNDKFSLITSKDGSQKLKYVDFDPEAEEIKGCYRESEFELENEDIQVDIPHKTLKAVMKAATTLSLEYVGFRGDGERVYMTTFNRRVDSDDTETNSFTIDVGPTEYVFDVFYQTKMLSMLDDDCLFSFAYSKKAKISRIDCGLMTYWAAFDKNSTIQFEDEDED